MPHPVLSRLPVCVGIFLLTSHISAAFPTEADVAKAFPVTATEAACTSELKGGTPVVKTALPGSPKVASIANMAPLAGGLMVHAGARAHLPSFMTSFPLALIAPFRSLL